MNPDTWERLRLVLRVYRPVAWLVFLTSSFVLFHAWMPPQMRMIIWNGLTARGILSSMLLVFSLLTCCDAFETLHHYTENNPMVNSGIRYEHLELTCNWWIFICPFTRLTWYSTRSPWLTAKQLQQ